MVPRISWDEIMKETSDSVSYSGKIGCYRELDANSYQGFMLYCISSSILHGKATQRRNSTILKTRACERKEILLR